MARETWPAALAFVWRPENDGQGFHDDSDDTGGDTNLGVTQSDWQDAVEAGLVSGKLCNASRDALALVLRRRTWDACQCDMLYPGVDLAVFNFAMVAGTSHAAKVAEFASGAPIDQHTGIIGPVTLAAIAAKQPADMIRAFTAKEEADYAMCPTAWKFLRGWDRRADDCQADSLQLAAAAATT